MRFIAWMVVCLARFPGGGGIPGYWAWFIGMIGLAISIFDTKWAQALSYADKGEWTKAVFMTAVPLTASAFVLIGYIIFNIRGGGQAIARTGTPTQSTGESVETGKSEPPV
jgi:hypothetical protein